MIYQTAHSRTPNHLATTDRLSERRRHIVGEVPNGMRAELLEEVALEEREGKFELGALQMLGGQLAESEGSSGHGRARTHAGRDCQEAINLVGLNAAGRETNYYDIYSHELIGFQSGTTVEDKNGIAGSIGYHPYPESPQLHVLQLLTNNARLTTSDPIQCSTLLYYSEFDHTGLAFLQSQRQDPHFNDSGHHLSTGMLGRRGLPLAVGSLPQNRTVYSFPLTAQPNIAAFEIGMNDSAGGAIGSLLDFWHVDLFGWTLPNEVFRSRYLLDRNTPYGRHGDEQNLSGHITAFRAFQVEDYVETPPWNQLIMPPSLVTRAWVPAVSLVTNSTVVAPSPSNILYPPMPLYLPGSP